jgi:hypothetical protein
MLDHNFSNEELLELRRKHKEKLALQEQEAQELHRRKVEAEKKEEADRLTLTIDKLVKTLFVEFNNCFQRFIITDDKKFAIEVDSAQVLSELLPGSEKNSDVPFLIHKALVRKINDAYPKLKFLSYIQQSESCIPQRMQRFTKKHTNFSIVFEPILHNIIPCDIISENLPRWKSIKTLPQSGSVYVCYTNVTGEIRIHEFEGTNLSSSIKKPDLLPTFWLEKLPSFKANFLSAVNIVGTLSLISNIPVVVFSKNVFIGLILGAVESIAMLVANQVLKSDSSKPPSLVDILDYLKSNEYLANKEIVSWYDELLKDFAVDEKTAKQKALAEFANITHTV